MCGTPSPLFTESWWRLFFGVRVDPNASLGVGRLADGNLVITPYLLPVKQHIVDLKITKKWLYLKDLNISWKPVEIN